MLPTCFNVLVYQMDSTQKATAAAKTSFMDTIPSLEDEQEFDASTVGVMVVVDPVSSSVTPMEKKLRRLLIYFLHPIMLIWLKIFLIKWMFPISCCHCQWSQMQKQNRKRIIRRICRKLIILYWMQSKSKMPPFLSNVGTNRFKRDIGLRHFCK